MKIIGKNLARAHIESDASGCRVKRGTSEADLCKLIDANLVDLDLNDQPYVTRYGIDVVCSKI